MNFISNSIYENSKSGNIKATIMTPVFNRKDLLARAMSSVNNQTNRCFEYIIVNDGSTENLDDVVKGFMDNVDFPVLYIKKPNGGVHTARNAGVKYARGEFICFLDSDDELVPNAVERFLEAWENIPENERCKYREITARCCNQNGEMFGELYPDDINSLPWKKAYKKNIDAGGDKVGFMLTSLMKECPWPEVEGINFITESFVLDILMRDYRSYYINDNLKIVHVQESGSYTSQNSRRSLQNIANGYYGLLLKMNTPKSRTLYFSTYIGQIAKICVGRHILKTNKGKYNLPKIELNNKRDKLAKFLLYLPCLPVAIYYNKKWFK